MSLRNRLLTGTVIPLVLLSAGTVSAGAIDGLNATESLNPSAAKAPTMVVAGYCNPCNPCAAKHGCNPCNPCAAH